VPPTGPSRLRPGDNGGGLPAGEVIVRDKEGHGRRTALTDFVNVAGVILIVPQDCRCDAAVQNIARQAGSQRLQVWLVADGRTGRAADDVHSLATSATSDLALVGEDPGRLLASTYKATGLTAVLLRPDRIVRKVVRSVQPRQTLTPELQALKTPS
jgi:hypothetical protein